MTRLGTRLLLACLLIGFGIFYGLDMAKSGIEKVNGPMMEQTTERETQPQEAERIEESLPLEKVETSPISEIQELRPITADKAIHRLANKTGRGIQVILQGGVELVVSLFEGIIH